MFKRILRVNRNCHINNILPNTVYESYLKRRFTSSVTMPYTIELINDGKVVLATMNSNVANFFNEKSFQDWTNMLDEIENTQIYNRKPIIFTSPEDSKCFSAGMDLKTVAKTSDIEGTKQLFGQFEDTCARIATLQNRTIAKIHGHAIAGGFFIGLACDVRCGLDNDNIGIGITEIEVGVSFPSLMYLLILNRIPQLAWKILVSQPSKLFTPKQAYKEGYFTEIASDKHALMDLCINEANRVHSDSMEAYLSVKNYLWNTNIAKQWNDEKDECMNMFAKVRNSDDCQRRMEAMLNKLNSKKSKL
eukprot:354652_1